MQNWAKIKFRLLIISKFSSLKNFNKVEIESVETEEVEEIHNPDGEKKWYIIESDSKNKQIWNMFTNIFYMISFFNFPLVIAFDFTTFED